MGWMTSGGSVKGGGSRNFKFVKQGDMHTSQTRTHGSPGLSQGLISEHQPPIARLVFLLLSLFSNVSWSRICLILMHPPFFCCWPPPFFFFVRKGNTGWFGVDPTRKTSSFRCLLRSPQERLVYSRRPSCAGFTSNCIRDHPAHQFFQRIPEKEQ